MSVVCRECGPDRALRRRSDEKFPVDCSVNQNKTNLLVRIPKWLSNIIIILMLVYASCFMITDSIGTVAQRIVVVSGLFVWICYGKGLRKNSLTWLLLCAILIPLVSWGAAHLFHPQWAEASPKVHRLTSWFMFIPVAIWLGGREKNILMLWSAALCGLLISPWVSGHGWAEISRGLSGGRVDFGLHNAQHAGLLFAVALLGLISFSRRFLFSKGLINWIGTGLWGFLVVFLGLGVLMTQTRGVWLGLVVACLTMFLLALYVTKRDWIFFFSFRKVCIVVLLGSLVVTALFSSFTTDIVKKRLSQEQEYILKVVGLNDEDVAVSSSVGARVTTWVEGLKWAKKRPLTGWGGGGRKLVLHDSKVLPPAMRKFGHFHNSYIGTLVMFGLLGLFLYLGLLFCFVLNVFTCYRKQHLSTDFFLFFMSFLGFWLVVSFFESYMFFSSGTYILSLIFGGFFSQYFFNRLATRGDFFDPKTTVE